jgi:hypothetical protein
MLKLGLDEAIPLFTQAAQPNMDSIVLGDGTPLASKYVN